MELWLVLIGMGIVTALVGIGAYRYRRTAVVAEDSVAVTSNRDGFIRRVLPAGRHVLGLFEKVDFVLETKSRLVADRTPAVATADGVVVSVSWSGIYTLQPDLIEDKVSQRLRGLVRAEKTISRSVDIYLRKLVGSQSLADLFNPVSRERLERQLNRLLADRLKPQGVTFGNLNLQVIDLPAEVAEALNKARAIKTLDEAIRQVDATTRDIVRGVYQLDEVLHWDTYLPVPPRVVMRQAAGR